MILTLIALLRGIDLDHRIDIHTQTLANRSAAAATTTAVGATGVNSYHLQKHGISPNLSPYEVNKYPEENVTRTLYQESDIDWKTHSLPSLGRVSSENTLGSSGPGEDDCYAIRKSVSRANKSKQVSLSVCVQITLCLSCHVIVTTFLPSIFLQITTLSLFYLN